MYQHPVAGHLAFYGELSTGFEYTNTIIFIILCQHVCQHEFLIICAHHGNVPPTSGKVLHLKCYVITNILMRQVIPIPGLNQQLTSKPRRDILPPSLQTSRKETMPGGFPLSVLKIIPEEKM